MAFAASLESGTNNPIRQWAISTFRWSNQTGIIHEVDMKRTLHELFHTLTGYDSHNIANNYYDSTGVATILNYDQLPNISSIQLLLAPQHIEDLQFVVDDLQINDPDYMYDCNVGIVETSGITSNLFLPNPTIGMVYSTTQSIRQVKLFSSNGEHLETIASSNNIDLSSHASGLYFLVVFLKNESVVTQRLVKI